VGWHMDALLAEYISGNPPNLSLSGFWNNLSKCARNFFWSVADLRATIKFNNVCRNFSSSLYYVSSTKDFEVLDKSFQRKI
jgi:hypothetical protein